MSTFSANIAENMRVTHSLVNFDFWLNRLACCIANSFDDRGKVILCGNSISDISKLCDELICKFSNQDNPYTSLVLIESDHSFARQVEVFGREQDIFIGISSSGNMDNILKALRVAVRRGLRTALFVGENMCRLDVAHYHFVVNSHVTVRIQEAHAFLLNELVRMVGEHI